MVTDGSLDGLPAELRKAAFVTSRCKNDGNYMRREFDSFGRHLPCCVCGKNGWEDITLVPAVLVEKEMKRVNEEVTNCIYLKLIKKWCRRIKDYAKHECSGTDGEDICFTKKDFEYAFGKCKCEECKKEKG